MPSTTTTDREFFPIDSSTSWVSGMRLAAYLGVLRISGAVVLARFFAIGGFFPPCETSPNCRTAIYTTAGCEAKPHAPVGSLEILRYLYTSVAQEE